MNVDAAIQDIMNRTLARISGDLSRLICLASTRDYNTGRYHHEGLASHFTEEVAESALETCHRELFEKLTVISLEGLVRELEAYVASTAAPPMEVIETWERLQPYRVTIPLKCDPLSVEFFFSNIKSALAILRSRGARNLQGLQSS
jgi:hypothetical protein